MQNLEVSVASGDALDVRQFTVDEPMSELFTISLLVVSSNRDIDFDAIIGKPAAFSIATRDPLARRAWDGVCSHVQQLESEPTGLSTYYVTIVPRMWLLTQRRNYRIFQMKTEPEIACMVLREWGIEPTLKLRREHKARKYRVQYAESNYDFVKRMLESAGVSFYFENRDGVIVPVLDDAPQTSERRISQLPFAANSGEIALTDYASNVLVDRAVRPGRYTVRDHDYRRRPEYNLLATAANGIDVEEPLEQFHYVPGAFLYSMDKPGDDTVTADDRGKTRTDETEAAALAARRLSAERNFSWRVTFTTNARDLRPGVVLGLDGHPRADLGENRDLLIVRTTLAGGHDSDWVAHCDAVDATTAYHPPLETPRPTIAGVESATVVGPKGEEIHTDEFGRVRVHFHWDRESKFDENSSCWIHVSQAWAGAGYGASMLPRVGQEVLVDFLGGDPDRPIVTGRVYTAVQTTPYGLPANKTQSGWKSNSSPTNGGYNEIMMEDKAGSELVRIRAQKDQQITVLHDRTASVGHNCSTSVGNNSNLQVGVNLGVSSGANTSFTVGKNMSTTVTAACSTSSGGPMSLSTSTGMSLSGGPAISATAKTISVTAAETMTLTAGNGASTIILCASGIIINGPKVWVNPGADQIQNILKNGEPTLEDPPAEPSVMDQLCDQASKAVTQSIEFAQQHPGLLIAAAAPLLGPLAPLAIGAATAYAVSQAVSSNVTPASPMPRGGDFGGGGAGGNW